MFYGPNSSGGIITLSMRKFFFLLLGCFLLSGLTMQAQSAQVKPAPDQRFGMTEAFWMPEEAIDLGVGWERILFYWREIQPTGPDDWNTLHVREEWLAMANSQGRMVVGLLKNTAPWASEDGTEAGIPKGLYLPTDDPGNLWAQFVRRIAAYYGPRNVHHWIVWNEPEIRPGVYGHEFAGSVNDYYQLLKVTYKVMKEIDQEATIHLAGLTWWHDQTFLGQLFGLMVNDPEGSQYDYFFDVISLHIYFRSETMNTVISSVQSVERQFGFDKPIWVNETNAPPNQDPEWPVERPVFDVDLDQQAWFIVQALSLGFAAGAERISAYKLIDINLPPGGESFGLVRPDLSRRPAYDAYRLTTTYLHGFSEVQIAQTPDYFLVTFSRPTGTTHVAWARTAAAVDVIIPAELEEAAFVDMLGQTVPVTPVDGVYKLHLEGARCAEECLMGGPPLFVVEEEHPLFIAPSGEEVKFDFGTSLTDIDSQVEFAVDSLTPLPTILLSTQAQIPVAVTPDVDDIISDSQINIQQMPESVTKTPTETDSESAVYREQSGNESTSTVGIWVIGLGLIVAAGLVLFVRRGRIVE
jgi:hypothetical protein